MNSATELQNTRTAVLIPAYRPNHALTGVVRALRAEQVEPIVVVNDGSGPEFEPIFAELSAMAGVTVVRHAINLGKGAALKTGINYILAGMGDFAGIVTADADGQHHPDDIRKVIARFGQQPEALVMGMMPAMMGMLIPASWQRSRKSKKSWLSKNNWVQM